jgi:3-hydroxypropanoate dehydrogenase
MTAHLIDRMFLKGRTHSAWLDKQVDDALLEQAYDLAKMGPTSANCCPMRLVFIKSRASKEKLKPFLAVGNVDKAMAAPITAIIAYDLEFYNHLPRLFPHADARSWFVNNAPLIQETALRNSALQAAYFMLAARSLGLDCGPMSGFDNAGVDRTFFGDSPFRSNFLCNLGYGDSSRLFSRSPRLTFDEVSKIL